jgi:hypothetical protein
MIGRGTPSERFPIEPERTRRIIQIEAAPEHIQPRHLGLGYAGRDISLNRASLYALCNDGTLWCMIWHDQTIRWERLRDIPQD